MKMSKRHQALINLYVVVSAVVAFGTWLADRMMAAGR
jgi:hypothetical protein